MSADFISGCFGGLAGVVVGHPFDTVKVRLQTQDASNRQYRGVFHCFYKIIANESFKGLYKGVTSPMYGVSAVNAIVFGIYGNLQRNLPNPDSISSHFIAGSTAGFVQTFVCSPMELVKLQLQLQGQESGKGQNAVASKYRYKGASDCLKRLYQHQGIKGVYRGLGVTLAREIPSLGTFFASYEYMQREYFPKPEDASPLKVLCAGGLAGMLSWAFTYPMDVIKSRYQGDGYNGHYKYSSVKDCVVKSYRQEGLSVFSRGFTSTIIRAFPTNAATFLAVSYTLKVLNCEITYRDIPESEIDILFVKTGATLLW